MRKSFLFGGLCIALGFALLGAVTMNLPAQMGHLSSTLYRWISSDKDVDQVALINVARTKLQTDQKLLEEIRDGLVGEMASAERSFAEEKRLLASCKLMATEFRDRFRAAEERGQYPVEVAGSNFNREQLISQIKLLVSECKDYDRNLEQYRDMLAQSQQALENIQSQLSDTRAKTEMLGQQEYVVRANEMSSKVRQLVSDIESVLKSNQQVFSLNPIKMHRQLAAELETARKAHRRDQQIDSFLAGGPLTAGNSGQVARDKFDSGATSRSSGFVAPRDERQCPVHYQAIPADSPDRGYDVEKNVADLGTDAAID